MTLSFYLPNSSNATDGEQLSERLLEHVKKHKSLSGEEFVIKMATYKPEDDSYSLLKRATRQFEGNA